MTSLLNPTRGSVLLLVLASLALSAPAFAQGEDEAEPEEDPSAGLLLVWGPSSLGDSADVAASALKQRLSAEAVMPQRVLRISDWLGAARFRIGGSAGSVPCTAIPSDIEIGDAANEIAALNRAGQKLLDDLEPKAALVRFNEATSRIACQESFISRDTIWEAYFYGGIAAYLAGDNDAEGMFRQAASIDPERQWDSSYPPDPQSAYLSAVQDVITRPKGRVFGDIRGTNYVEVRLDGEMLDLTKAFESSVHPGLHLVQAVDDQGRWSTWVRKVNEAATLTFFSDTGLEQMMLEGPDGVLANVAAAQLTSKANEEGLDEIYLVTLDPAGGRTPRVFAYTPAAQRWTRLERTESGELRSTTVEAKPDDPEAQLTRAERNKLALLRDPDYRSSASFGFKFLTIQRCGPAEEDADGKCDDGFDRENTYLGALVGIDIRLVKGLNLDIGFGALMTDFKDGGNILPEVRFGLRYRFLTGVMQPFLAVAADIFAGTTRESVFASSKVAIYGGITGYGGIDFEFPDGFRLSLEGGGGLVIGGEGRNLTWPNGHMMVSIGRFVP